MSVFPSVCGGYGIRGDKGESGPGVYFQGAWSPTEEYATGDMVTTSDGIFITSEGVASGVEPPIEPWRLLVLWSEITGPAGPPGPPGPSRSVYTHSQSVAASLWTVSHDLGYFPAISVIDVDGYVMYANVRHVSTAQAVINFPSPMSGVASCT